jgi:pathogenesis-related protein 1
MKPCFKHWSCALHVLAFFCCGAAHADFGDTIAFEGDTATAFPGSGEGYSSGWQDGARIIEAHNKWRAEVGVPGIAYSKKLASSAQAWADVLKNSHACGMRHSNGTAGENLFWTSAVTWSDGRRTLQQVDPKVVVDAWGSEKKHYRHADNGCASAEVCGHYTQLVWKNTTSVGCGMAVCGNRDQIWVCQYSPAGNWAGQKPY